MAVPLIGRPRPRGGAQPARPYFGKAGFTPKKPFAAQTQQPYNWTGAENINWFPGLNQPAPGGGFQLKPGVGPIDWGSFLGGKPQINVGGGGGGGGYEGLIGGDYGVQEMESMMNARMGRARGDFQSQIRQALIDLGITDKSKLGSLGSYIDSDTISKAAENKYSQTAKIAQRENAMRAQSEADLASRGLLSSGQLTTNAENILAEGESGRYGALRDFLGAGQSGLTQLADMNEGLAMQLSQARADAAARAASLYQYGMGGPNTISPNASGFYDVGGALGLRPSGTGLDPGVSSSPLGQKQWMAKHPGGSYYNYLRAWHRQHPGTGWGY